MTSKLTAHQVGLKYGFKSGLEDDIALQLDRAGEPVFYETFKIPYRVEKDCTYTPDYLLRNGIIVEGKGRFETQDRQKQLLIKKQHPDLDIRFVFSRSSNRIGKASRTTYAMWCQRHGFQYADKVIPEAWLREPINRRAVVALRALFTAQKKEFPL